MPPSRIALTVLSALLLSLPGAPARAEHLCRKLDVPGSTWTQLWQLTNNGVVAAGSDLGAYTYSGGAWLPLAPLPPGAPYAAADLGALGVNDAGVVAGPAWRASDSTEQGFILRGGSYQFFSYLPQTWPYTEPRGIGNNGVVTGLATNGSVGVGFIYNPDAAPGFSPGFTEVVPTLNGVPARAVIPGAMNERGQFVGSANFPRGLRYGFLYDPAANPPISLFHVDATYTAGRGINSHGEVVGFTHDAAGATVGFQLGAAGLQYITCPTLPGVASVTPQSINDSGVISGCWGDVAGGLHGFIAYPDVVLPVGTVDGAFRFDVAVKAGAPVFLDPAPAVGYRYAVGAGDPRFASVTLPIGVGDGVYTLLVAGNAFTLAGGQRLDFTANGFANGVTSFTVVGIEPAAALDPADATAFVTEVTFGAAGRFTGTMTPLTVADELADLAAAVAAAPCARGLLEQVREAQEAYAKGDVPETCENLGEFIGRVGGRAARRLGQPLARALAAEARAISDALACPASAPRHQDDAGDAGDD